MRRRIVICYNDHDDKSIKVAVQCFRLLLKILPVDLRVLSEQGGQIVISSVTGSRKAPLAVRKVWGMAKIVQK